MDHPSTGPGVRPPENSGQFQLQCRKVGIWCLELMQKHPRSLPTRWPIAEEPCWSVSEPFLIRVSTHEPCCQIRCCRNLPGGWPWEGKRKQKMELRTGNQDETWPGQGWACTGLLPKAWPGNVLECAKECSLSFSKLFLWYITCRLVFFVSEPYIDLINQLIKMQASNQPEVLHLGWYLILTWKGWNLFITPLCHRFFHWFRNGDFLGVLHRCRDCSWLCYSFVISIPETIIEEKQKQNCIKKWNQSFHWRNLTLSEPPRTWVLQSCHPTINRWHALESPPPYKRSNVIWPRPLGLILSKV